MSRWTRAELETLDEQIYQALVEDRPATVRNIFYRMTDPRLEMPVDKTLNGYRRVQGRLLKLRRNGTVPWSWIVDTTRAGQHVATFDSPTSSRYQKGITQWYRNRFWPVEAWVEVWCESRSTAGVIQNVCDKLAVSLYATAGFSSDSLYYEASLRYGGGDHVNILLLADYDPAGEGIVECVERGLKQHAPYTRFEFTRVAVTPQQIRDWHLPGKPRKWSERRRPDIEETVELEAIPPPRLRSLLTEHIHGHLPEGHVEKMRRADEHSRSLLAPLFAEALKEL